MPLVEFETTILVFELAKIFAISGHAANLTGQYIGLWVVMVELYVWSCFHYNLLQLLQFDLFHGGLFSIHLLRFVPEIL
jgi:hypothetical protein